MISMKVFDGVPKGLAWNALATAERKGWAVRVINEALAELLNTGQQPDIWETKRVAIACLRMSKLKLLSSNPLQPALTPPRSLFIGAHDFKFNTLRHRA